MRGGEQALASSPFLPVRVARTSSASRSKSLASFLIDGRDMKVHFCWRLSGYRPFPVWLARAHSGGKQMEAKCAGPNRELSVWHGPPYSVCPVLFALISSLSSFGPCQFALSPVRLARSSFVSHSTSPASFLIDGCDMKVHICRRSYAPPTQTDSGRFWTS